MAAELELPPATSTLPFGSKVAVWLTRGSVMLLVAVNILVEGSNTSAVAVEFPKLLAIPPVIRTRPSDRRVAVCWARAELMLLRGSVIGTWRVADGWPHRFAMIVVVPNPTAVATPLESIGATVGAEEFHTREDDGTVDVLPSS